MKTRKTLLLLAAFIIAAFLHPSVLRGQDSTIHEYTLEEVPNVKVENNTLLSDPEHIISAEYADSINFVLKKMEDSLKLQCAVVVLPNIEGGDATSFGYELFNKWGIGNKGTDKGVLMLLITGEGVREIKFETGYGMEGILPDAICKRIQTQIMVPLMKEGNYGAGVLEGVRAVYKITSGESDVPDEDDSEGGLTALIVVVSIILFFICLNYIATIIRTRKTISTYKDDPFGALAKIRTDKSPIRFLGIFVFPLWIPFLIINAFQLSKVKKNAICDKCGSHSLSVSRPVAKTLKKATKEHKGEGNKEVTFTCKKCGNKIIRNIPFTIPYIEPNTSSGSSSGPFSGSSSGSFGGSFGGGHSGGGGASTHF